MRGLGRLTGHESCMRVDENYKRLNKMFLSICLTLRKNQKQAMSKSLAIIRRRRKKENIITYHRQVTAGVMTRTISSLTCVKKRRKRTVEATRENKEIKKEERLSSTLMQLSLLV